MHRAVVETLCAISWPSVGFNVAYETVVRAVLNFVLPLLITIGLQTRTLLYLMRTPADNLPWSAVMAGWISNNNDYVAKIQRRTVVTTALLIGITIILVACWVPYHLYDWLDAVLASGVFSDQRQVVLSQPLSYGLLGIGLAQTWLSPLIMGCVFIRGLKRLQVDGHDKSSQNLLEMNNNI